jgi:hypothetical protein
MAETDDLIRELAAAEGLTEREATELARLLRARRERKNALARREQSALGFPASPVGGEERGIAMYGEETASEAYERFMAQEMNDPEGVYGPGGGTAGGIFGDAPIAMPDYDPTAHRRSESRAGGMANVKLVQLLSRLVDRLDAVEAREASRLPEGPPERRLGGRGRGR